MTKLLGEGAIERTAAILLGLAKNRLVIRGTIDYVPGEFPHIGPSRRVSIYLLTYCRPSHTDKGSYFEVRYNGSDDPRLWYGEVDLSVRSVGVAGPLSPELYALKDPELVEITSQLALWEASTPPLSADDQVLIYHKDRSGEFKRVSPSCFTFVVHLVRLHVLLLERGHHTICAWETDDLLKRLGAFLGYCMQDWERVIG